MEEKCNVIMSKVPKMNPTDQEMNLGHNWRCNGQGKIGSRMFAQRCIYLGLFLKESSFKTMDGIITPKL